MQNHLLDPNHRQQHQQHQHQQKQQHHCYNQHHHQNHLQINQRRRNQQHNQISDLVQRPAMMNPNKATTTTSSASPASSRSLFCYMMLALFIAHTYRTEAKPLNQYQVRFRRVPPKDFSAALGSSITIECEAGASPPPAIHWLKDGKRIVQNELDENQLDDDGNGQSLQVDDVSRIALSTTRARLYIDCADSADEATYTCVAENAYSRVSSHTKLNLIKPIVQPVGGNNENDLISDEVANPSPLSAVPQCLNDRGRTQAPARIHMWTHNIVEIMKNNVVLLCRSNIKRPAPLQQDLNLISGSNKQQQQQQGETTSVSAQASSKPMITWVLPNDKPVSEDLKDKYEVLETGDLLIKDLSWSDMGSYVCTASDEQSSDSVSSFVYPASVKAGNSKRAVSSSSTGRLSRFT